jgi:uncharacterized protein YigA (DUF484 family)
MFREMVKLPFDAARAAIELPRNMSRSVREANELMEVSREQLELMRRQADQALEQAERMNELLARVVRLTEPLERAARGGEVVAEGLKRAIFGEQEAAIEAKVAAEEQVEGLKMAREVTDDVRVRGGGAGEAEAPPDS